MLSPRKNPSFVSLHRRDILWDLWCLLSVVGIWPRFIEPKTLSITQKDLFIDPKYKDLDGLKILHLSDLHLHLKTSSYFLRKVQRQVQLLQADLIVFTGDFICYSNVDDSQRLQNFLKTFQAPYGCYACLGNHDYGRYATVKKTQSSLDKITPIWSRIFYEFFHRKPADFAYKKQEVPIEINKKLLEILKNSPFRVLNNETLLIEVGKGKLNMTGLGDLWAHHFNPKKAFKDYDALWPGIVLSHNPDTCISLANYPGDIIFSGHTHGSQVNLPYVGIHTINLEHKQFKRGLVPYKNKMVYVNRGIGSHFPFRWFSKPEILLATLRSNPHSFSI